MEYRSELTLESKSCPGVTYTIARMSLERRLELTRCVWELAAKAEFLEAGQEPVEKLQAAALAREIDRLYLRWGLRSVDGLTVDGAAAAPETVISAGPEELAGEILAAIKSQCGLNAAERKN